MTVSNPVQHRRPPPTPSRDPQPPQPRVDQQDTARPDLESVVVVTAATVPSHTPPDWPQRRIRISEQVVLLNDLTRHAQHFRPGAVHVTLHPDHPPETGTLSVFQEQNGVRIWPDGQPWTDAQLRRALNLERHCPPSAVKRHTLNVTARCANLPGNETLMGIVTVTSVLLCLLLGRHLPPIAVKALWGATVFMLICVADHTEFLRGLAAYALTARIRRCNRPDASQDAQTSTSTELR